MVIILSILETFLLLEKKQKVFQKQSLNKQFVWLNLNMFYSNFKKKLFFSVKIISGRPYTQNF